MNKFKEFCEYCNLYQSWVVKEKNISKLGITLEDSFLEPIDGLLSLIPELIFNSEGVELFWDLMSNVNEFTQETIDELWDNLQEFQL
jgi:hypothetical protein